MITETKETQDLKCLLSEEESKGFVILGEQRDEVPDWTPLCTYLDGIRWHVLFKHKVRDIYKYMWVHTVAGPEGEEIYETSEFNKDAAIKKYEWMKACNSS